MQQIHRGRRGVIAILLAVVVLGVVVWSIQQGFLTNFLGEKISSALTIEAPVPATSKAKTTRITAAEGGIMRVVDEAGVVITLDIPKGALTNDTNITLTPTTPNNASLHYGVKIEPENTTFNSPVTLSFNWHLSNKFQETTPYTERPFVVRYLPETESTEIVAPHRAIAVRNFMPALVTNGGWYGVSDVASLMVNAAEQSLVTERDTLSMLEAGLVLSAESTLSKKSITKLEGVMDSVFTQKEPNLHELHSATLLEETLNKKVSFVPRAYAYGLFDGYLQFRCNYADTRYEDALIAMKIAMEQGYADVALTCKKRAEKLLIERAQKVDSEGNRPVIDAIEVVQQMQLLGLDDDGGVGERLTESLKNDITATIDARLAARGQTQTEESEGRVRSGGPSSDPLFKGDSTLIAEMMGVAMSRVVGIETFDEAGLKKFGNTTHKQMSGLIELGNAACGLASDPLFAQLNSIPEFVKNCDTIESGKLQQGMDMWKEEVGEYAEGVDAVQDGETPDANWDDTIEL